MPFTFSHPAIILPLAYLPKRWFSLTGLIIGSLSPDFEYFIRMKISSIYSHTINGLFWFDLPLVILLSFLFHNIVRDSLIDNLPLFLKSRFIVFKGLNWNIYFKKNWFVVMVSILIGAFSHLFWDSFTHDNGYFVERIPLLTKDIFFFEKQIPILKILQHSSTFIGAIIIAFAVNKLPKNKVTPNRINSKYWIILIALSIIIVSIKLIAGLNIKQYGNLIVTMISAILISLTLTPMLVKNNFQNK